MKFNKVLIRLMLLSVSGLSVTGFSVKYRSGNVGAVGSDSLVTVPIGGNAWRTSKDTTGGNISNNGIENWTNRDVNFTAYVRFAKRGKIKLWLNLQVPDGKSRIAVTALKTIRQAMVTGSSFKDCYIGEWNITDTGYAAFQIKAIGKTGLKYADINSIKLSGSAVNEGTAFVKNNEGDFFYWGRRGPSVHLGYVMPDNMNIEWLYNEVTVPKGNDVLHAYFMADGFAEGYFGMQVNSPT